MTKSQCCKTAPETGAHAKKKYAEGEFKFAFRTRVEGQSANCTRGSTCFFGPHCLTDLSPGP